MSCVVRQKKESFNDYFNFLLFGIFQVFKAYSKIPLLKLIRCANILIKKQNIQNTFCKVYLCSCYSVPMLYAYATLCLCYKLYTKKVFEVLLLYFIIIILSKKHTIVNKNIQKFTK